jgi:hypothetical protein
MPHEIEVSQAYLREREISVSAVVRAEPVSLKVAGTPTVLLVDERGIVKKFWRGMLRSQKEEDEVISSVSIARIAT